LPAIHIFLQHVETLDALATSALTCRSAQTDHGFSTRAMTAKEPKLFRWEVLAPVSLMVGITTTAAQLKNQIYNY
jgi:hypothetical protein